jgi:hypothetical protein
MKTVPFEGALPACTNGQFLRYRCTKRYVCQAMYRSSARRPPHPQDRRRIRGLILRTSEDEAVSDLWLCWGIRLPIPLIEDVGRDPKWWTLWSASR